ncbi:hypothetical protein PR048_000946 [Dryococelus australis]|uniref:Uncharacterized protein n=1 Tax=Dryococelus australis TaxID=614101 RepID=A0ABQ9IG15_9NEOP|nr:hypothetical protein PR048_000946 [Dryococelus australis]
MDEFQRQTTSEKRSVRREKLARRVTHHYCPDLISDISESEIAQVESVADVACCLRPVCFLGLTHSYFAAPKDQNSNWDGRCSPTFCALHPHVTRGLIGSGIISREGLSTGGRWVAECRSRRQMIPAPPLPSFCVIQGIPERSCSIVSPLLSTSPHSSVPTVQGPGNSTKKQFPQFDCLPPPFHSRLLHNPGSRLRPARAFIRSLVVGAALAWLHGALLDVETLGVAITCASETATYSPYTVNTDTSKHCANNSRNLRLADQWHRPGAAPRGVEPGLPGWEAAPSFGRLGRRVLAEGDQKKAPAHGRCGGAQRVRNCRATVIPSRRGTCWSRHERDVLAQLPAIRVPPSLQPHHYPVRRSTVVGRLACSPPTKANRVQTSARLLPDFRMWESCRTMPLADGFSRRYPFSLFFHSGAAVHLTQSSSSVRTTSLLRASQIPSLTHSLKYAGRLLLNTGQYYGWKHGERDICRRDTAPGRRPEMGACRPPQWNVISVDDARRVDLPRSEIYPGNYMCASLFVAVKVTVGWRLSLGKFEQEQSLWTHVLSISYRFLFCSEPKVIRNKEACPLTVIGVASAWSEGSLRGEMRKGSCALTFHVERGDVHILVLSRCESSVLELIHFSNPGHMASLLVTSLASYFLLLRRCEGAYNLHRHLNTSAHMH